MKKLYSFYILIAVLLFFVACSRSAYKSEQKDLNMLIKRLGKKGGDDKVIADIRSVYDPALQRAEQNLSNYRYDAAPQKWDKMIAEMQNMQRMYDIINTNLYAMRMVKPVNFYRNINEAKDSAAADYYTYAERFFEQGGRTDLKEAYSAYNKANSYVANYRDTKVKMQKAFDLATVHVLVNPIQYDATGFNNWGWNQYNNRDEMTYNQLLRDLGGRNRSNIPAIFYNEWELRRESRAPDYSVDLVWRNMRFNQPQDRTNNYARSKQIETGKDTANRPIYQTVTATVYVTQRVLEADADMNIILNDIVNRRQNDWDVIRTNFRYDYEFATYSGDRRALTENDLTLIGRSQNQPAPSREDAMREMLQKIYNDLLNRIRRTVNW